MQHDLKGMRTDLAMELASGYESIDLDEYITVTNIKVDSAMSRRINKPTGDYVTIESNVATKNLQALYPRLSRAIADSLQKFVLDATNVLVVGLGNPNLTADALGSEVLKNITITRHLYDTSNKGKVRLSAFSPSVLGVTGIESYDIVSGIVAKIKPNLVIAVDSLASAAISRIASAFQICSSGITPGSGVSNHKQRLDKQSLGVDVISIGVPMVVYADIIVREALSDNLGDSINVSKILSSLDSNISSLIVTPKEVDLLVEDCGKIIADAINMTFSLDL